MAKWVLLVDPDGELQCYVSSGHGYPLCRIIAESSPELAMAAARRSRPHVIVAPVDLVESWARHLPREFRGIQRRSCLVVTADRAEQASRWRRWTMRGCEVLLRPVTHAWQLYTAIEWAGRKTPFVRRRDLPAAPPLPRAFADPSTDAVCA